MKLQNSKKVTTEVGAALNFRRLLAENRRLREELYDTTTKKHQEMSRAIQLYENNRKLRKQLHDAEKDIIFLKSH